MLVHTFYTSDATLARQTQRLDATPPDLEVRRLHSRWTDCPLGSAFLPSREPRGSVAQPCPQAVAARVQGNAGVVCAQPAPGRIQALWPLCGSPHQLKAVITCRQRLLKPLILRTTVRWGSRLCSNAAWRSTRIAGTASTWLLGRGGGRSTDGSVSRMQTVQCPCDDAHPPHHHCRTAVCCQDTQSAAHSRGHRFRCSPCPE